MVTPLVATTVTLEVASTHTLEIKQRRTTNDFDKDCVQFIFLLTQEYVFTCIFLKYETPTRIIIYV